MRYPGVCDKSPAYRIIANLSRAENRIKQQGETKQNTTYRYSHSQGMDSSISFGDLGSHEASIGLKLTDMRACGGLPCRCSYPTPYANAFRVYVVLASPNAGNNNNFSVQKGIG